MRVTLFKLKKPKRFSYKPRHYDPVLEDLHHRIDMIKSELEQTEDHQESTVLRSRIRKSWNSREVRKANNSKSTFRIALIFLILMCTFYVYFFTDFIS
jgi:hypothetical protein